LNAGQAIAATAAMAGAPNTTRLNPDLESTSRLINP
jgi:hypothetical protein